MKNTKNKKQLSRECNDCGEIIPNARLKLLPNTETCVGCQDGREKKGDFQRHKMSVKFIFKCDEIEATEETLVRGTA